MAIVTLAQDKAHRMQVESRKRQRAAQAKAKRKQLAVRKKNWGF